MEDRFLIPVSEIEIEYDPDKTTAYDFTVEDYFTFCTHDGIFVQDTMAMYLPVSKESQKEAKSQALSTRCLINPTDMKIITNPSQEMVLGLYLLSIATDDLYGKKVIYKSKEITYGMSLINDCFPEDFPVIDEMVTNKVIGEYIYKAFKSHNADIKTTLDNIKKLGFKYATIIGHTISLKGMTPFNKLRDEIYSSGTVRDQLTKITGKEVLNYLQENFKYTDMIESGARGSWDQARQLILTRGFISNFKGNILSKPVKNSFVDGLTPEEFFISTYGCRKGLLDVAIKTASSGYLSRKFLFACTNLMLDYDVDDCGTTDLMPLYINNISTANSVIGRWYTLEPEKPHDLTLISEENINDIMEKKIFMRSPLYCKTKKLCKKCYGELYKYLNGSRFVGCIAALALGESNTQLVLRTFHNSGSASLGENDNINDNGEMEQNDIVGALTLISKLVHKFDKHQNANDLVQEIYNIYSQSRFFMRIHFECLVCQLMWFDNRTKWRTMENRNDNPYQLKSIVAVPSMESWLMGLSFSNTKRELINGILNPGIYSGGVIDKILCGVSYKNI